MAPLAGAARSLPHAVVNSEVSPGYDRLLGSIQGNIPTLCICLSSLLAHDSGRWIHCAVQLIKSTIAVLWKATPLVN
jgi:hypothetical protein